MLNSAVSHLIVIEIMHDKISDTRTVLDGFSTNL